MSELTREEIEQIVIDECGRALLHLIAASKKLGHCTLKGHLVYQHENRGTISGDAIGWLRWMIAHNEDARNTIGYPEELGEIAEQWHIEQTAKALKGAFRG